MTWLRKAWKVFFCSHEWKYYPTKKEYEPTVLGQIDYTKPENKNIEILVWKNKDSYQECTKCGKIK